MIFLWVQSQDLAQSRVDLLTLSWANLTLSKPGSGWSARGAQPSPEHLGVTEGVKELLGCPQLRPPTF